MEDSEIVQLYWDRSEEAIAETSVKYGAYCHSISYGILRNSQDAEECVTDTYLKVWNAIPPQRPARLPAFLGKIARNLSLDRYRRRAAKMRGFGQVTLALEELEWSVPAPDTLTHLVDAEELTRILERFLKNLSQEKRRVFLLRYWYFRSIQEIAEGLHITQAKVTSILHRLRRELKLYLEKEGIGL